MIHDCLFLWLYYVTLLLKSIKPKAATITYIDPKGENDIFIDQLTKNWEYVVD